MIIVLMAIVLYHLHVSAFVWTLYVLWVIASIVRALKRIANE